MEVRFPVREAINHAHHEQWAPVVAGLTRRFGDLDIAEEAAADAFATAVERWPVDGVPPNPGGWLTTTAHRKAIDRIRRENIRGAKQLGAQVLYEDDRPQSAGAVEDERLRLLFTCCHPALAMEVRVPGRRVAPRGTTVRRRQGGRSSASPERAQPTTTQGHEAEDQGWNSGKHGDEGDPIRGRWADSDEELAFLLELVAHASGPEGFGTT